MLQCVTVTAVTAALQAFRRRRQRSNLGWHGRLAHCIISYLLPRIRMPAKYICATLMLGLGRWRCLRVFFFLGTCTAGGLQAPARLVPTSDSLASYIDRCVQPYSINLLAICCLGSEKPAQQAYRRPEATNSRQLL